MEKHYTDYKGREFPGTFTVPDYDENGNRVTVSTDKPSVKIPGELITQDDDGHVFRYPL